MQSVRRLNSPALPSIAFLLGLLLLPATTAAQHGSGPFVQLRAAGATHLAGFVVHGSQSRFDYQHPLKSTAGFGVGVGMRPARGPIGFRLDFDVLPRARLRQGSGPLLQDGQSGPLWWLTGSLSVQPAPLCNVVCLTGAAGMGVGRYPFDYDELSGDIMNRFIRPQTRLAFRLGLELSIPRRMPGLALFATDYVSALHGTGFTGRSISPMHVLVAGVAIISY